MLRVEVFFISICITTFVCYCYPWEPPPVPPPPEPEWAEGEVDPKEWSWYDVEQGTTGKWERAAPRQCYSTYHCHPDETCVRDDLPGMVTPIGWCVSNEPFDCSKRKIGNLKVTNLQKNPSHKNGRWISPARSSTSSSNLLSEHTASFVLILISSSSRKLP